MESAGIVKAFNECLLQTLSGFLLEHADGKGAWNRFSSYPQLLIK